ncbi:hypothetical protein BCR35DRAFT_304266 [Leucosporidium creatinivorum]|uniref:Uncharacterized protein n=1 Tax=Leucosporidium creatinivorum TaxID=106004 RepID=A0A1Y2F9Y5_9BASI|nr:hypothetical protein BCR35DRAFT_304266 [Leucosporidium creatinivorum]
MPLFHFYALAGVLVVGVAVVVAYEVADWHRREQERELEQWHAMRSSSSGSRSGEKAKGSAWEKRGRGDEGEIRLRSKKPHSLLPDTDPFRLTDSDLDLSLPSPSPSQKEATLLAPGPSCEHPHLSRRSSSSSSASTQDLLSTTSSTISTPTLVSRPESPVFHHTAVEEQGGWDLINRKLGEEEGEGKSRPKKALSEDDWEALEESVDWDKAHVRPMNGAHQLASI